jgi:Ni,Fe-hydrogenase I large subunit
MKDAVVIFWKKKVNYQQVMPKTWNNSTKDWFSSPRRILTMVQTKITQLHKQELHGEELEIF